MNIDVIKKQLTVIKKAVDAIENEIYVLENVKTDTPTSAFAKLQEEYFKYLEDLKITKDDMIEMKGGVGDAKP